MTRTPEQRRNPLRARRCSPEAVAALPMSERRRPKHRKAFGFEAEHAVDDVFTESEYQSEQLDAAQLGVGRFYDGRGL